MSATIQSLGEGSYLSLTTFKKDGSAVATPVWLVRDGDSLRVITEATSGKAKRIRSNQAVLVASCDMRGRLRSDQVAGTARLEDEDQTRQTASLVRERYGLLGRIFMWRATRQARRTGAPSQVGISITIP